MKVSSCKDINSANNNHNMCYKSRSDTLQRSCTLIEGPAISTVNCCNTRHGPKESLSSEDSGNIQDCASSAATLDLEKNLADSEHVIITVQGMTCTGCETKLRNFLHGLATVHNVQTSLVLSRAEFDVSLGLVSTTDILCRIQNTTGFKCEQILKQWKTLDVVDFGTADSLLMDKILPRGVTDIIRLDKRTVRISYDSRVIGARDLLHDRFGKLLQLAPPRPNPSEIAGLRHVRNLGFMTLLSAILTIPVLILAWVPLPSKPIAYGALSLMLATVVQFVVAGPFYVSAFKSLAFSQVIDMDFLVVLSTTTAYIFSIISFTYLVKGKSFSAGEYFH